MWDSPVMVKDFVHLLNYILPWYLQVKWLLSYPKHIQPQNDDQLADLGSVNTKQMFKQNLCLLIKKFPLSEFGPHL